ncbi:MlaD family protein [Helicobacter himalayensis]|uniref:MlaD family protein n=1 Tax=Helicobacter himalayensis TaxID=1591088 RepID=UPI003D6F1806
MERNVRYMSIGIVFISIVVGLCFFVLWLGRFDFNANKHKTYYIYTQDELSSVGVNTPVKFKGIGVGKVSDVSFEDLSLGQIKITLSLESALTLKEGAFVSVASSGLAGSNYLALTQGNGAVKNDTILELQKGGLDILLQKAGDIGAKTDEMITNLVKITSEENTKNISLLLEQLTLVTNHLNLLTQRLDSIALKVDANFKDGQYDIRSILNPTMLQLQDALLQMNVFFSKATHLVNKIEKNPYDSIFGRQKPAK